VKTNVFAAILFMIGAATCRADLLTPAWVELGDAGAVLARVIVSDTAGCPPIEIDGAARPMILRSPVPAGFRPACESVIPADAKSATVGGQSLVLPKRNLDRVLVMGDTGCRIKGARVQDCNDSSVWPFEKVASLAAAERPDLVVHVGDYLYREELCPASSQAKCGGTPAGDNWETWNADFFAPAAKLLRAAPWALARGNHEDCKRAWRGWFYYLDPRPWNAGTCAVFTPPYVAGPVQPRIVMVDSSAFSEDKIDDQQVQRYAKQFASIHEQNGWLVEHHPVWAVRPGDKGGDPVPVSPGLQKAWTTGSPQGIDIILSGHTHLFELVSFGDLPVQVVAGIGGTQLSMPVPPQFDGLRIGNFTVMAGESRVDFGYTLLTRDSQDWGLVLKNAGGQTLESCVLHGRQASCGSPKSAGPAR
jgi:predicted phosphodiesterase